MNIETKENIGRYPEVTFTITFDNDEKLIIDLSLLGDITSKVSDELDALEKRFSKKLELGLIATMMALGGNSEILKDLLKGKK